MRRSRSSLLLVALALSACATVPPPQQDLPKLDGQPVQSVIGRLGPASSQLQVPGGTTYVWTTETPVNTPVTQTRMDYSTGRPNAVETVVFVEKMQPCTLRVTANAAGIITAAEKDGVYAACGALASKLR